MPVRPGQDVSNARPIKKWQNLNLRRSSRGVDSRLRRQLARWEIHLRKRAMRSNTGIRRCRPRVQDTNLDTSSKGVSGSAPSGQKPSRCSVPSKDRALISTNMFRQIAPFAKGVPTESAGWHAIQTMCIPTKDGTRPNRHHLLMFSRFVSLTESMRRETLRAISTVMQHLRAGKTSAATITCRVRKKI